MKTYTIENFKLKEGIKIEQKDDFKFIEIGWNIGLARNEKIPVNSKENLSFFNYADFYKNQKGTIVIKPTIENKDSILLVKLHFTGSWRNGKIRFIEEPIWKKTAKNRGSGRYDLIEEILLIGNCKFEYKYTTCDEDSFSRIIIINEKDIHIGEREPIK